jgi:hypothetical protein
MDKLYVGLTYQVGTPVMLFDREGVGFVTKITHGRRPYHVQMLDGNRYVCSDAHLRVVTDPDARAEAAKVRRDLVRDAAAALGLTGNVYRQRYGRSARVAQQILTPTETERTA